MLLRCLCITRHETTGHPLLGTLFLGHSMIATVLPANGCSQATGSPPSDDAEMDKAMRWAIASALTIDGPVMTVLHLASKTNSAYTKWSGHPLVHVLMKCLPRGGAPRIPADFWVEHEEANNAQGKGLSSGLLVILIANRQGAEEVMSRARMEELQQAAHLDLALVDYCQPAIEDFPQGAARAPFSQAHTTLQTSQDIPELQKTICFSNLS